MGSADLTSVRITSWRAARGLRGVARGKASSGWTTWLNFRASVRATTESALVGGADG